MTATFRLKGYADSVGKGLGFLLPVFGKQNSNADFVQRVSDQGTVLGFEQVDEIEARMLYDDQLGGEVSTGEPAVMAFGFAVDDILVERTETFRRELARRFDDPALARNSFLAIEVAEFLGDRTQRVKFAERTYRDIAKRSSKAARDWSDLTLLTPDLRVVLASETGRPIADFAKVVATREDGSFRVVGLPAEIASNDRMLRKAISEAMRWLGSIYDKRDRNRPVLSGKPFERPRGPEPKAVVWIVDRSVAEARSAIEDDFEWRVDVYGPAEFDDFKAAANDWPGFAVMRRDRHMSADELDRTLPPWVTTIELGTRRSDAWHSLDSKSSRTRILVPSSGFNGAPGSPGAVGAMVRQIAAARSELGRSQGPAGWAFIKARGTGAHPRQDAAAAIYDRLVAMDLATSDGVAMVSRRDRRGEDDGYPGFLDLFENARVLESRYIEHEMQKSAADLAMMVPVRERRHEDSVQYARAVKAMLARRRLRAAGMDIEDGAGFAVRDAGALRRVEVPFRPDSYTAHWDVRDLMMHVDLDRIDTISIRSDATPAVVLGRLHTGNYLAANMRDLAATEPEGGIWSILGAQVRRHSGGMASKSRTHFMALLINHALVREMVERPLRRHLTDAINDPQLGSALHLSWGKVRQGDAETRCDVRLYNQDTGRRMPIGDAIAQFTLILHRGGIAVKAPAKDRPPS